MPWWIAHQQLTCQVAKFVPFHASIIVNVGLLKNKKQHIPQKKKKNLCGWNENVKMNKWKHMKIFDLKWEISLKGRSISYWWKYEGESFKMIQSCLDKSDGYINEK